MSKNILIHLGEAIDRYSAEKQIDNKDNSLPSTSKGRQLLQWFLPNGGTLIIVLALIMTQTVWARSLQSTANSSTSTIAYQGRLADSSGTPLTGTYTMVFRLYNTASGGAPLWEEQWTAANSVAVSDGLFNVMLGSITPVPQNILPSNASLWLGISVGTDSEMTPRVQLGSVPYAFQALTVPDGAITSAKLADGSVTQAKLGTDVSLVPPDSSITTSKLADGAVTSSKVTLTHGEIYGTPGGILSLTTTPQIVPSLSFSVNPTTDQILQLHVTLDAAVNGGCAPIIAYTYIDNNGFGSSMDLGDGRATISTVRQVSLTAGSHTVSIKAWCELGSGSVIMTGQSSISYILFSK